MDTGDWILILVILGSAYYVRKGIEKVNDTLESWYQDWVEAHDSPAAADYLEE